MNYRRILDLKRRRRRKLKKYFEIREVERIYGEKMLNMLLEEQEKTLKLPRRHASFFETSSKTGKELSVAQSYFQILESQSDEKLVSLSLAEDPPDVEILTDNKRRIGVEITELVNAKAIELQIKEHHKYVFELLSWNAEKFLKVLQSIISSKADKCGSVSDKYDELTLLIFTDEPMLTSETMKTYLDGASFTDSEKFSSIYILTSYEPSNKGKSLIQVGI
ncbi:hypothetical protein [Vibrio owensii]|uniref:hypothetical protein n=1 Tax=Vibrio owensii TaxID=696485 RepID=UPI002FF02350